MRQRERTIYIKVTLKTRQADGDTAYDIGQLLEGEIPNDSSWGDEPLPYEAITSVEYVSLAAARHDILAILDRI